MIPKRRHWLSLAVTSRKPWVSRPAATSGPDLAQSSYWLRRAVRAEDPWIPNLARITFDAKVAPRMTNDETQRCLSSLKERSEAPE